MFVLILFMFCFMFSLEPSTIGYMNLTEKYETFYTMKKNINLCWKLWNFILKRGPWQWMVTIESALTLCSLSLTFASWFRNFAKLFDNSKISSQYVHNFHSVFTAFYISLFLDTFILKLSSSLQGLKHRF